MLIFTALVACIGFFTKYFFSQLLPISLWLHQHCLAAAPSSRWQEYYQAIVCSAPLSLTQSYQQLQGLGLLHIIVVSGSHLIFFSHLLDLPKNKVIKKVKPFLLLSFVLIGRMDPPVFRAFIFLAIHGLQRKYKLAYNNYQVVFFSIIFCISLFPQWVFSQSFLLSWAASLGIHFGKTIYTKSLFCYILLAPALSNFASHNPLSIILNVSITPLISIILFPASLLSFIFPVHTLTDLIWDVFFSLCQAVSNRTPTGFNLEPLSLNIKNQWIYLLSLNFLAIEFKKRKFI